MGDGQGAEGSADFGQLTPETTSPACHQTDRAAALYPQATSLVQLNKAVGAEGSMDFPGYLSKGSLMSIGGVLQSRRYFRPSPDYFFTLP
jgi:hypothetical protein